MPDDNGGTECDLACQTKIILNGGNLAGIATSNQQSFVSFFANGGKMKHGQKLIEMMNKAEDDLVAIQKFAKDCMGYDGPTGRMLE